MSYLIVLKQNGLKEKLQFNKLIETTDSASMLLSG